MFDIFTNVCLLIYQLQRKRRVEISRQLLCWPVGADGAWLTSCSASSPVLGVSDHSCSIAPPAYCTCGDLSLEFFHLYSSLFRWFLLLWFLANINCLILEIPQIFLSADFMLSCFIVVVTTCVSFCHLNVILESVDLKQIDSQIFLQQSGFIPEEQ